MTIYTIVTDCPISIPIFIHAFACSHHPRQRKRQRFPSRCGVGCFPPGAGWRRLCRPRWGMRHLGTSLPPFAFPRNSNPFPRRVGRTQTHPHAAACRVMSRRSAGVRFATAPASGFEGGVDRPFGRRRGGVPTPHPVGVSALPGERRRGRLALPLYGRCRIGSDGWC